MEPVSNNLGVLYLVFIQVVSRLLTFVGNQFLLRYVSPSLLGLAVQLELLSVTILYTSRESLRVALQRQPKILPSEEVSVSDQGVRKVARDGIQQYVNMGHVVVLIGVINSLFFGYGYLRKSGSEVTGANDFGLSLKLYALATLLELWAEPAFIVIQQTSLYKARARAETGAAICKCLSACLTTVVMSTRQSSMSVLPFAVGQLVYALTLLVMYQTATMFVAKTTGFSLLPRRIQAISGTTGSSEFAMGLFSKSLLHLTATFYTQSFFKLLLTQGDSLILSFVADLNAQGAFALASNYGGLLSRLIFQPIEESSRTVFGRLLGAPSTSNPRADISRDSTTKSEDPSPPTLRGSSKTDTTAGRKVERVGTSNTAVALNHLSSTLHIYTLFSLPILALLPHVFPLLISAIIGSRWSSPATAQLLSAYAYYLPFLAINGILDAFVTSVASPKELRHQSVLMMLVTIIYGIVAWLLMTGDQGGVTRDLHQDQQQQQQQQRSLSLTTLSSVIHTFSSLQGLAMGPAGLVWANVVNMSLRIVYSVWYIRTWIARRVVAQPAAVGAGVGDGDNDDSNGNIWRRSLPNAVCIVTAVAVAIGLNVALNTTEISKPAGKSFLSVRGLDANDAGSLLVGALVLASSMLFFEHKFLISMVMSVVPQRLAAKIQPYLPMTNAKW